MKKSLLLALLALHGIANASDVVSSGKSFATSRTTGMFEAISDTSAKKVPGYNTTPPQTSIFSSGSMFNAGVSKINECKSGTPSSDRVTQQECDAVNFLAKNPETRKKVDIAANDPALVATRSVIASIDPNMVPTTLGTGCVTTTTTGGELTGTQVCHEYLTAAPTSCVSGTVVAIDADANYSCDKGIKDIVPNHCSRGTTVTVTTESKCTPGQKISEMIFLAYNDALFGKSYRGMELYCGSSGQSFVIKPYSSSSNPPTTRNYYSYQSTSSTAPAYLPEMPLPIASGTSLTFGIPGMSICAPTLRFTHACSGTTCTGTFAGQFPIGGADKCTAAAASASSAAAYANPTVNKITPSSWQSANCSTLQQRSQ